MFFSKIHNPGSGFTNQIIALISNIITAYNQKHKVIIVDEFLNDIYKTKKTPISEIINLQKINIYLKEKYDIILIDRYNIDFNIISVKHKKNDNKLKDLTNHKKIEYLENKKIFFDLDVLNDEKNENKGFIFFQYNINGYFIEEIYDNNILIDFEGPYTFIFNWSLLNCDMFGDIMTNIIYNDDFIFKSHTMLKDIDLNKKINIIHLRLEDDGISHWSMMNAIPQNDFKFLLEDKYINIIKNNILHDQETIILSSNSKSNRVINFLDDSKYNYKIFDKFFEDREFNAIVDLLVSKCCNNIFIGNYNLNNNNGSTFSYYISKLLNNDVKKICIDLDKIYDSEIII